MLLMDSGYGMRLSYRWRDGRWGMRPLCRWMMQRSDFGMLRNVGYCFAWAIQGYQISRELQASLIACAALQVCKLEILFTLLNNYVWVSAVWQEDTM